MFLSQIRNRQLSSSLLDKKLFGLLLNNEYVTLDFALLFEPSPKKNRYLSPEVNPDSGDDLEQFDDSLDGTARRGALYLSIVWGGLLQSSNIWMAGRLLGRIL